MRILIIDDNREFCQSLMDVLEMEGHSVVASHDGPSAIDILNRAVPDVLLIDMIMPGLDGLETFRRIKMAMPSLPTIMISGFSMEDRLGEAFQEGIKGFLPKPVNFPELLDLIDSLKPGAT